MALSQSKPPMDSELKSLLAKVTFPAISHVTPEIIQMMRSATATPPSWIEEQIARGISHREIRIPSQDGSNHEIVLAILEPASKPTSPRPCIYWIHGGGFHWGDRLHTLEYPIDVVLECDAVCVSVEYRLAPEHSFSVAVEDCYAGLKWTSENSQELGIDPTRLMIGGTSAGGCFTASTVLLCRERQGPVVCAQFLSCPALDDRLTSISSKQYLEASDFLPRAVFEDVWKSTLKNYRNDSDAAITVAARADDLTNLPMAYLEVGSAEVLRDETVAYALKLWAHGIQAELHVWAGGFHGFDIFLADAAVSKVARQTKVQWTKRVFGISS